MTRSIEPRVAYASAMMLAVFTTLSSSLLMIIFKKIQLDYAIHVLLMTLFGALPGLFFQQYIQKKYGRVSFQVSISVISLGVNIILMFIINIPGIVERANDGEDLF